MVLVLVVKKILNKALRKRSAKAFANLESFGQLPEDLIKNLEDIGSVLYQAGCRFGVAADTSAITQQQTQEISQDKPQDLNKVETKTGGIERL